MIINLISPNFYPALSYGGPIFSTFNTATELSNLGNTILVSTTNANWDKKLEIKASKEVELSKNLFVKYYNDTILNRFSFPLLWKVRKDIQQSEVIWLQYIFSISTPVALLYAKLQNKPLLLSPRGSLAKWILTNGFRKNEWINFLIKPFANSIYWHATSEQEKAEILDLFPKAKVFIIPNGINLNEYKTVNPLSRKEFALKFAKIEMDPEFILVSMGRLQKKKGFDILIKAFKEINLKYPTGCLLIAGEDEGELLALKNLVKDLSIENNVHFVGSVFKQEKVDFLANADLFVLPSHNENFGNVYAEALAAGTPIIASQNTPWKEVEVFNCGKWVKNSPNETAGAINELLSGDLNIMGKNGIEYIAQYSWANIAKEFDKVFKEMIKVEK